MTLDPTRPDAPKAKNFVTQLDPTQSDPWMNPTHVQFWFVVTTAKLRETSRNFQSNRSVALRLCYWIATCQHSALQWGAVFHLVYYAPPPTVGNGAISVAFVRPSVCLSVSPSVAYIANNSRTQRHSVPNFGKKVPHLWCDSHTRLSVSRSNGQRSGLEASGGIPRRPNSAATLLVLFYYSSLIQSRTS